MQSGEPPRNMGVLFDMTCSRNDQVSKMYVANGCLISQRQLCQNNAIRMLSLRRIFDHITPVLKDLHWPPSQQRTAYKVLPLTYNALQSKAPAYLSCCLYIHQTGDCDQRPEFFSQFKDAVWEGLADAFLMAEDMIPI